MLDYAAVIKRCSYHGLHFFISEDLIRPYLQVQFNAPCAKSGTPGRVHGRKWFLSRHMTESEFVQTAFAAVLAAIEHEAREHFRYYGQAVFGPHFDVNDLVLLAMKRGDAGARQAPEVTP